MGYGAVAIAAAIAWITCGAITRRTRSSQASHCSANVSVMEIGVGVVGTIPVQSWNYTYSDFTGYGLATFAAMVDSVDQNMQRVLARLDQNDMVGGIQVRVAEVVACSHVPDVASGIHVEFIGHPLAALTLVLFHTLPAIQITRDRLGGGHFGHELLGGFPFFF